MKVLAAIDSSGASQYVIAEAAARPWPTGTVLCIQSVVDMWAWDGVPEAIEDAKREAKTLVAAATCELSRSGYAVVSELEAGLPSRAVPEYAGQWGADLIMVGSHRSNAVARFHLGSVSRAVLRNAPSSVEIVRPNQRERTASSPGMKILLGTDGSDCSDRAIDSVATRPWPTEALFRVISVREPMTPESTMAFDPILMDEILDRERRRAEDALKTAERRLSAGGLRLEGSSDTLFGDPRTILLDEAKSWGADLIALGSHGLHGFEPMLLGSVSESVAMHAHCSVEVIRDASRA